MNQIEMIFEYDEKTDELFIKKIMNNNKLVNLRCNEHWLKKNNLYDELMKRTEEINYLNPSILSRLQFLKCGRKNRCKVCGDLTNVCKGEINQYCSNACWIKSEEFRNTLIKHNLKQQKVSIHKDTLIDYYINQRMSCVDIAKQFDVSNVSIMNRLKKLNIKIRSHSENQKVQAEKENNVKKRKIFSEIRYTFDRTNYNIDYISAENQKRSCCDIAKEFGCSHGAVNAILKKHGMRSIHHSHSSQETKIVNLLNQNSIEHEVNTKKVITPLELDIYIPKYNLAIEVNGAYWHSELQGKDKNYHLNKTLECISKNIQLLQFWDFEIDTQWDLVSSMILAKLGIYEKRIGARKCKVKEVDSKTEGEFLNQNHLQGSRPSTQCYGLFYQDELVSLMSFSKPRFNKKADWELLRFCNKTNTQVLGGASKLFKKRPEGSIVSYADRRYSDGNIYEKLGMKLNKTSSPSYYYTNNYQVFYNRVKFQKHKLSHLLESFDPAITEWENMKMNGYDRIWDCGTFSFLHK